MNSVNLKDTELVYRNLSHFYTLTANYHKREIKKTIPIYNHIKMNNTPINKPKGDERPVLQEL